MQRNALILTIVVLIGAVAIGAFFLFGGTSPMSAPEPTAMLPVAGEKPPADDRITLTTGKGTVRVLNFYKTAVASSSYDVVLYDQYPDGIISFFPQTGSFNISIGAASIKAFREMRPVFEERFRQLLGITPDESCDLEVYLGVPQSGVEVLDGVNYGISGCEDSFVTP